MDNTHRFAPRSNAKIEIIFDDIDEIKGLVEFQDKIENDQFTLIMKYSFSKSKRSLFYKYQGTEKSFDENLLNKLREYIEYIYIPASRNNKDLEWHQDTIFRKLIIEFSKQYTRSRDTVSNYVDTASKKLHKSILLKIESQLKDLYPTYEELQFSIGYNTQVDYNLLLENLILNLKEKNNSYSIMEYGSGIKSLTVISLYRLLATISERSVILGIEEPETNLHPQMQKQFISSLRESKKTHETQLLVATHSTVIVDTLKHDEIILVRRELVDSQRFVSTSSQLSEDFWVRNNMGEFGHYQFFNYRNSDFFFSKYIIITESKTDAQVISHLITKRLGWKMGYISILNLDGVKNLAYPYYLLKELKIPFSVVVDKDFFVSYSEDELDASRDLESGFPLYSNVLNNNHLINNIFDSEYKKIGLLVY